MAMSFTSSSIIRTIADIWASQTGNSQSFSREEVGLGIEQQGPVVSKQVNGALKDAYSLINTLFSFSWYNPQKDYDYNSIVVYIHQNEENGQNGLEFARCINQSEPNSAGVKAVSTAGQLPYTDATAEYGTASKGSAGAIFKTPQDGVVNSQYWEILKMYNHLGYRIVGEKEYEALPAKQKTQDIMYFIDYGKDERTDGGD